MDSETRARILKQIEADRLWLQTWLRQAYAATDEPSRIEARQMAGYLIEQILRQRKALEDNQ